MPKQYSDQQLQAYLDESLNVELMSQIESDLRASEELREQLISVAGRREAGVHGLGDIWRRNRLSCPTRQQLGSYLLKAMSDEQLSYIQFHLEEVGCRVCRANLDDLNRQQTEQQTESQQRRRRYFQTSAGYLSQHGGSSS